ncbi:MAG: hypothetical protein M0000_08005 [Actinomycetota bacterium]|nr:hypothetical protein [Actinomycetota bacterium]
MAQSSKVITFHYEVFTFHRRKCSVFKRCRQAVAPTTRAENRHGPGVKAPGLSRWGIVGIEHGAQGRSVGATTLIRISAQDVASFFTAGAAMVTAWMAVSTRSMAKEARRSADASVKALEKADTELKLLGDANQNARDQYESSVRERRRSIAPILVPVARSDPPAYMVKQRETLGPVAELRVGSDNAKCRQQASVHS